MNRYLVPKGKRRNLQIEAAWRAGSYFVECETCGGLGPGRHFHKGARAIRPSERRRQQQRGD